MITLINPSNFRQCLILSVLCERAIEIKELNDGEETPGIKESQMKIIKLI
jgi:RNA 3'-terminal phosphate cyclase